MGRETEAGEIHRLDETTVRQIAAGEVVERPASAVKELVENAIDAGASRVRVAVSGGGSEGITVSDDGQGMTARALRQAVQEHTTSKLGDIGDLEAGVSTLGFRGEALYAIGGVARLEIRSRTPDNDRGAAITVDSGTVGDVEPVGCPVGTTVEISDLFGSVPARRKYLKQDATEFAHINRIVSGYALANPDCAIRLEHDGNETFGTPGRGDLTETLLAVYGREVAESVISVDAESEGPLDRVEGLVSDPETTRSSRAYLTVLVNGRLVTDSTMREAIVEAYGRQLATDRYPFAVLSLQVDPQTVDVNVHPRKLRVRYDRPEAAARQVRDAVQAALGEAGILRSSAPRGKSAPEVVALDPSPTAPSGAPEAQSDGTETAEESADGAPPATPQTPPDGTGGGLEAASDGDETTSDPAAGASHASAESTEEHPPAEAPAGPVARRTQTTLQGEDARLAARFDRLPDMRVLGQAHETYILAETEAGLVMIDQHAADERVNYERLRASFDGATTSQRLAEPVTVELTAVESAAFDAWVGALERLGFEAERADERSVLVRSVPGVVAETVGATLIRDLLSDLLADERTAAETVEAIADELLADLACHPSITGNTSLTEGSVTALLEALDACEEPWACPHGRPVVIQLDSAEIEARFERDYPGHGG